MRAAKAAGLAVTAEATTHHFTLTHAELAGYDPVFKVNPPLRTAADVAAVKAGLADGTIDAIATDHAPHTQDAKELPLDQAPPGHARARDGPGPGADRARPADRAGRWRCMSWQPAAIAGLATEPRRAHRGPGRPADLCVIDPTATWTVDPAASGQPQPQHALRRAHADRPGPPHHRRRRGRS